MKYEASFPFYGLTKNRNGLYNGYKLYAIHVFFHKLTIDGGALKKYKILSVPDQPHEGFTTLEEFDEFVFNMFEDLAMFQDWAKEFKKYGATLSIWQKQNLKPFKFE